MTPIAWLNDGQQVFAATKDNHIRSFDVSTGSQLAELHVHGDGEDYELMSIILAANGKFRVSAFAASSILFCDTPYHRCQRPSLGSLLPRRLVQRNIVMLPGRLWASRGSKDGCRW